MNYIDCLLYITLIIALIQPMVTMGLYIKALKKEDSNDKKSIIAVLPSRQLLRTCTIISLLGIAQWTFFYSYLKLK